MRAIGFNLGLRGDLIMGTVKARAFKLIYPNSHLTLGIGSQFEDVLPLFYQHPFFDNFHIYDSYDKWPTESDIFYLKNKQYDLVFHGMPKETSYDWWKYYHQCYETCLMHGLTPPENLQCELFRWFSVERKCKTIAFAPFAGFYNPQNDKKLTIDKAQDLINRLNNEGFSILFLGGADEPNLENCIRIKESYFHAAKRMLGCDLLLHTDTGIGWVASAYSFPCVGLYSSSYYDVGNKTYIQNIQPINKNAIYLSEKNVNFIENDIIVESINKILK